MQGRAPKQEDDLATLFKICSVLLGGSILLAVLYYVVEHL